jgi:hypothetical protein
MNLLLALLLLPLPSAPAPSVDELIERVESLDKQRTEIEKQRTAAIAELKARLKEIQDRLDRLNIPTPKPPEPEPPKPNDPLATKLKAAFEADAAPAATKREHAKDLAALYRQAAKLAADEAVPTSGELLRMVREASGRLVGADALKDVRRVVAGELGELLPTDGALSGEQRKQAAALFAKLAAVLDGLGGG